MNVEIAKVFFKQYNGQGFHMFREEQEKYEAYRKLNITKEKEGVWAHELLFEYKSKIISLKSMERDNSPKPKLNNDSTWLYFGKAIELAASFPHLRENLFELLSTNKNQIRPSERVIIAESLLGRGYLRFQQALPFYCYKDKNPVLGKNFLSLAEDLLFDGIKVGHDIQRHNRALNRLSKIRRRLRFPFFYLVFRR